MMVRILTCTFAVLLAQVESSAIWYNDTADAKAKEVCMKELGCFSITDDFKSLRYRPINVLPNDRVIINTKFNLYTRKNTKDPQLLVASKKKSIDESHFDPKLPVIFIVHGFMESQLNVLWMGLIRDEFLILEEHNVIIVDWSGGNRPPYYQATSNTRVVGAEIAVFIEALEQYTGIKREDSYIIGHSLGSHVAGYAGKRLKTLGRITGLDPADPYFSNMPASVRLDPTDASFVDVIHSDSSDIMFIGLGMTQKVGHVDFYPNSGRNQPGCKTDKLKTFITDGLVDGLKKFALCNHQRSVEFLQHTINYRTINPVGYECADWNDFLEGKCAECGSDTKKCAIMGIRAIEYKPLKSNSVQHAMYLKTSGKAPYWQYHYYVTIKLFKPKTSYKDVKGTIDITLFGSKADELAHVQKSSTDLNHGSQYQYLVTTDKNLGEVKSVSLKWFSSSWNPINLIKKPNLYVEYITVASMNEIEKSPRKMANRVFCDKPGKGTAPKTVANFNRGSSCDKLV